jgi:hypothetical protein
VKRAVVTAAGILLFACAVLVALSFEDPLGQPPAPARTVQLYLALAALFPAGAAAYLAGRGQYRPTAIAAAAVLLLYTAIAAISAPLIVIPVAVTVLAVVLVSVTRGETRR